MSFFWICIKGYPFKFSNNNVFRCIYSLSAITPSTTPTMKTTPVTIPAKPNNEKPPSTFFNSSLLKLLILIPPLMF